MFKQLYKRLTYTHSYFTLEKQLFITLSENEYLKKENDILRHQIKTSTKQEIKYSAENTLKNYDKHYNNIK